MRAMGIGRMMRAMAMIERQDDESDHHDNEAG